MQTITAMFDSRADAEVARARLAAAGINADNVTVHDQSSLDETSDSPAGTSRMSSHDADEADGREGTHRNAIGDYIDDRTGHRLMENAGSDRNALGDYVEGNKPSHAPTAASHDNGPGIWTQVKAFFTSDHDVYAEGMRRGGYLLVARVQASDAARVSDILDDEGTIDLGARETEWRNDGWMGSSGTNLNSATTDQPLRSRVGNYDSDSHRY